LKLQDYNFTLWHILDKANTKAEYPDAQGRTIDEKDHSRSNNVEEDDYNRQARDIGRNQKK